MTHITVGMLLLIAATTATAMTTTTAMVSMTTMATTATAMTTTTAMVSTVKTSSLEYFLYLVLMFIVMDFTLRKKAKVDIIAMTLCTLGFKTNWTTAPKLYSTAHDNGQGEVYMNTYASLVLFRKNYEGDQTVISVCEFLHYIVYMLLPGNFIGKPDLPLRGAFCSPDIINQLFAWNPAAWTKTSNVYGLYPGQFTDDGIMAVSLMQSLCEANGDVQLAQQNFVDKLFTWYPANEGTRPFDIGGTTKTIMDNAKKLANGKRVTPQHMKTAANEANIKYQPWEFGGKLSNGVLMCAHGFFPWTTSYISKHGDSEESWTFIKKTVYDFTKLFGCNFAPCQLVWMYVRIGTQMALWDDNRPDDWDNHIKWLLCELAREKCNDPDFINNQEESGENSKWAEFCVNCVLNSLDKTEKTHGPYEHLLKQSGRSMWEINFTSEIVNNVKTDFSQPGIATPEFFSALSMHSGGFTVPIAWMIAMKLLLDPHVKSYNDGIGSVLALGHHSDTDTNAAIAGALLGMRFPKSFQQKDMDQLMKASTLSKCEPCENEPMNGVVVHTLENGEVITGQMFYNTFSLEKTVMTLNVSSKIPMSLIGCLSALKAEAFGGPLEFDRNVCGFRQYGNGREHGVTVNTSA
jgi:hypothetical protein